MMSNHIYTGAQAGLYNFTLLTDYSVNTLNPTPFSAAPSTTLTWIVDLTESNIYVPICVCER